MPFAHSKARRDGPLTLRGDAVLADRAPRAALVVGLILAARAGVAVTSPPHEPVRPRLALDRHLSPVLRFTVTTGALRLRDRRDRHQRASPGRRATYTRLARTKTRRP